MASVIYKDWYAIRRGRPDITDYLIHWTHGQMMDGQWCSPFHVLKTIAACGYLRPSFAPKQRATVGGSENTIKGNHPAVCFTEQPLDAFLKSCRLLPGRYKLYGIAVHKWHIHTYRGRPAIYGDESLLHELPDDQKYLWVRYNPVPERTLGGYPIDWTHEREWRVKTASYSYGPLGVGPEEGVPLLLPPVSYPGSDKPVLALPRFLVSNRSEMEDLKEELRKLPTYRGANAVLKYYFDIAPQAVVIPLDEVSAHLEDGDQRYARLETLPYGEIDPSIELPPPESYL